MTDNVYIRDPESALAFNLSEQLNSIISISNHPTSQFDIQVYCSATLKKYMALLSLVISSYNIFYYLIMMDSVYNLQ